MVDPLVLFQVILAIIVNNGLSVNKRKPANPTMNKEIPTQTVPSKNAARQANKEKDTVNKSIYFLSYRPSILDSASTASTLPVRSNRIVRIISATNCSIMTPVPSGIKN